jgi:DNA-binding response OmpR family regulator
MAREVAAREPGLIILGLHVGQDNGLDLLRDLRSHSDVPVIVLTGRRYDESDWVVGLELGADDYLIKPFSLRELLARARAKLRRLDSSRDPMRSERKRDRAKFGDWQLDRRTRRLINGGGETVALTKGEWGLLLAFLESPQRPLTRGYLLQATRIHQDLVCRAIDVQVFRLRRKLEADPSSPRLIQTERGVGYVFASPVKWL